MNALFELFSVGLAVTAAAWFWRAQGVREVALAACRARCAEEGIVLLDGSVVLVRMRVGRRRAGGPGVWREWEFEFTVSGAERHAGRVRTLGKRVQGMDLPPWRVEPPAPPGLHQAHVGPRDVGH